MIMRCKDKKGICLVSTTHDDKMVPTRVWGQDKEKPEVSLIIISGWKVWISVMLTWQVITAQGKDLKRTYQKYFRHWNDICCLNSYLL
jgi:hypothetical protein